MIPFKMIMILSTSLILGPIAAQNIDNDDKDIKRRVRPIPVRPTPIRPIPVRPIPIRPIPSNAFKKSLGTPRNMMDTFSTNLNSAVKKSFPTYKEGQLTQVLSNIKKQFPQGVPGHSVKNYSLLQRLFDFPKTSIRSRNSLVLGPQTEDRQGHRFTYGIDIVEDKLFVHHNLEDKKPLPYKTALKKLRLVKREHQSLIKKMGIQNNQMLFSNTDLILIQGQTDPKLGTVKKSTLMADSIFTYGLRHVNGIMVEENYIKLYSKDSQSFEGADIKWPTIKFHPSIREFKLKNKRILMRLITQKLKREMNAKSASNVKMAVVLRPVKLHQSRPAFYIPSIKVGAYSKNGEAGNLFYVDLLAQTVKYINEDAKDSSQASQ